jgi:hypothetical protein
MYGMPNIVSRNTQMYVCMINVSYMDVASENIRGDAIIVYVILI